MHGFYLGSGMYSQWLWSHDATVREGNRSLGHFADSLLDVVIQAWLILKDPLQSTTIGFRQVFLVDQFAKHVSRILSQNMNLATRTFVEPALTKTFQRHVLISGACLP